MSISNKDIYSISDDHNYCRKQEVRCWGLKGKAIIRSTFFRYFYAVFAVRTLRTKNL